MKPWQYYIAIYFWIPASAVFLVWWVKKTVKDVKAEHRYLEDDEGRVKIMNESKNELG